MTLASVILFACVAAATVLKRQGNNGTNGTVENPFAGIPDLSDINICTNECKTWFQLQKAPPSDWSTTCTPTFAAAVQGCLNCISTSVPPFLLTEDVKEFTSTQIGVYLKNCVTLASTTEALTLPTALSPTGTQSGSNSPLSISAGSNTASSLSATKTSGAVANSKVQVLGFALAAALVGALAAF